MLPIILISDNKIDSDHYIAELVKKRKIQTNNIFKIFPIKEEITISQIRDIKKVSILQSNSLRLFVIFSFDNSSTEVQNAMLKSLEESSNNLYVLMVKNQYAVLPTIRSRALSVNLNKGIKSDSKMEKKLSSFLLKVASDNTFSFLGDKTITGLSKEEALDLIDEMIIYFHNSLFTNYKVAYKIINNLLKLKNLLRNNNLNPQMTLDNLLISIKKLYMIKKEV